MLKTMEIMKYDALNIGARELRFGKAFLERSRSTVSFPYIASNLISDQGTLPWTSEYVIKEAGGIKAAVLGIFDPDDLEGFHDDARVKGLKAVQPETALKKLLPEASEKADLVILLSQMSPERNLALLKVVKGVDIAIFSGARDLSGEELPQNLVVLDTGSRGMTMGLLKITLDDKRVLSVKEKKYARMDRSVPGSEEVARLVETHKNEQAGKEEKLHKELMEGLKLTPEEFIDRYRKNEAELRKGEAK